MFSMKLLSYLSILIVAVLASEARADVECVFGSRSTMEGLEGLDSHRFRVATGSSGLILEMGTADGGWLGWGQVVRVDLPSYVLFQHYPIDPDGDPSVLTINRYGEATLLMYVDPYRPWLYYGECIEN